MKTVKALIDAAKTWWKSREERIHLERNCKICNGIVEIGPGLGALTKPLLQKLQ